MITFVSLINNMQCMDFDTLPREVQKLLHYIHGIIELYSLSDIKETYLRRRIVVTAKDNHGFTVGITLQ